MEEKKNEPDNQGAVESDVQRISAIKGDEALGYKGAGREEHSGENPPEEQDPEDELANNRPEEVK